MSAGNFFILDENPIHAESHLEWWYVHGSFQGKNTGKHSFMLTIFKHRVNDSTDISSSGFSCIFSLFDHTSGQNRFLSKVNREFYENFIQYSNEVYKANIDTTILETIVNEYKKYGAPHPICISDSEIKIDTFPFGIQWDEFQILKKEDRFFISFKDPASFQIFNLNLFFDEPGCCLSRESISITFDFGMEYFFHPGLRLSGLAGDDIVEGKAWMDHQWGDFSMIFRDEAERIVLGWEWMGINLDHGTDLMIMIHRNAESGIILSKLVFCRFGESDSEILKNIEFKPVKYWESPVTLIRYPIEYLITIPDLDAEIMYLPFSEAQEIPFFGLMRAIWQGAGEITGTMKGNKVYGSARLELNGFGYIFDFRKFMESVAPRIDNFIENFFPRIISETNVNKYAGPPLWKYEPDAYTKVLSKPVWDLMSRNGKRWRPIFARLLLGALGTDPVLYEELLFCLTELGHTGSLIIDDIEDNSLLRRGEDCIHIKYGYDLAINAANTLYFLPNLLLFEHPYLNDKQKYEISELITRGYVLGHLGQGLDLYWSKILNSDQLYSWILDSMDEKILQMYAFKTASSLKGLAEMAAIIAGKDDFVRKACSEFATALGVAFQIIDDIHNFSNNGKWKKTTGEDIAEGKLTYVIYQSLKMANLQDKNLLSEIISNPEMRKDPDFLRKGIDIVKKSGALEFSRNMAMDIVKPKWENLSGVLKMSDQKILLRILSFWLLEMNYD